MSHILLIGEKIGTYFTQGGRVFDSERITIEGGREKKWEEEEERRKIYHSSL
jgi:hypothetical protein